MALRRPTTRLLLGAGLLIACGAAAAETVRSLPAELDGEELRTEPLAEHRLLRSGTDDRQRVAVTLRQDGPARILERREVGLRSEPVNLRVEGVPESLRPETLMIRGEYPLQIRSAALRTGNADREGLLRAHLGGEVALHPAAADAEPRRGTLLGVDGRDAVVQTGDGVEFIGPEGPWRLVLDSAPEDLVVEPVLDVALASRQAGRQWLELGYLADGIDWSLHYVAVLDAEGEGMDLTAWAELANRTRQSLRGVDVRLVAAANAPGSGPGPRFARLEADHGGPQREAVADQHRYRLDGPIHLDAGERRQRLFMDVEGVPVTRSYRATGRVVPGRQDGVRRVPVEQHLRFVNEEPALDGPLPAGPVRVYRRDGDGESVYIGADHIPAAPAGEAVELRPGGAFDLVVEREQRDWQRVDDDREEQRWEVRLRNAGEEAREIRVSEVLPGDWTLLDATREPDTDEGGRLEWVVTVPGGEAVTLDYHVALRR